MRLFSIWCVWQACRRVIRSICLLSGRRCVRIVVQHKLRKSRWTYISWRHATTRHQFRDRPRRADLPSTNGVLCSSARSINIRHIRQRHIFGVFPRKIRTYTLFMDVKPAKGRAHSHPRRKFVNWNRPIPNALEPNAASIWLAPYMVASHCLRKTSYAKADFSIVWHTPWFCHGIHARRQKKPWLAYTDNIFITNPTRGALCHRAASSFPAHSSRDKHNNCFGSRVCVVPFWRTAPWTSIKIRKMYKWKIILFCFATRDDCLE